MTSIKEPQQLSSVKLLFKNRGENTRGGTGRHQEVKYKHVRVSLHNEILHGNADNEQAMQQ